LSLPEVLRLIEERPNNPTAIITSKTIRTSVTTRAKPEAVEKFSLNFFEVNLVARMA
jgi:flagellar biosynthesis GTPase FlhF